MGRTGFTQQVIDKSPFVVNDDVVSPLFWHCYFFWLHYGMTNGISR